MIASPLRVQPWAIDGGAFAIRRSPVTKRGVPPRAGTRNANGTSHSAVHCSRSVRPSGERKPPLHSPDRPSYGYAIGIRPRPRNEKLPRSRGLDEGQNRNLSFMPGSISVQGESARRSAVAAETTVALPPPHPAAAATTGRTSRATRPRCMSGTISGAVAGSRPLRTACGGGGGCGPYGWTSAVRKARARAQQGLSVLRAPEARPQPVTRATGAVPRRPAPASPPGSATRH